LVPGVGSFDITHCHSSQGARADCADIYTQVRSKPKGKTRKGMEAEYVDN